MTPTPAAHPKFIDSPHSEYMNTPPVMKIDSIVVFCWPGDFRLARICLASVRYFYPDIPLYLMKNIAKGDFDTTEVERRFNVSSLGLTQPYGSSLGKLELFFQPQLGRFLFIDADQIMAGPVLQVLEQNSEQFVVVPEIVDEKTSTIDKIYYNRRNLARFDPDFIVPKFHFNSGQFVGTAGVLSRDDFSGMVEWGRPLKGRNKDTFVFGDQSILNYVFPKLAAQGRITLGYCDFMELARTEYFWSVPLDTIRRRKGRPTLLHWAGIHRSFLFLMRRSELLRFFEKFHYAGLRYGAVLRRWRSIKAIPRNTYLWLYYLAGMLKRRLAIHPPARTGIA